MINPVNMTLRECADSVILAIGDARSFGKLMDEERWQDWAMSFVRTTNFTQQLVPDPYQFSDWREWAQRAYPMLEAG